MLKRVARTTNLLARLTAFVLFVACGKSDNGRITDPPVLPPVVIPPTLVAGTAAAFDAALNEVLAVAPFVTAKDQNGNAVVNVWVKWTPSSGKVENDSSLTDSNGRANAGKWTLGTVSGTQTVTARVSSVSVVAMTANVAPGPFAKLVAATSTITGVVGSTVSTPASVKAVDAFGNAVPRVQLQFGLFNGGGILTGRTQTTDDSGIATVGSWQLGPTAGLQSIRVDDPRTGITTMIFATALPAPASQFVVIDGNSQTGQSGKRLCISPVIAVRDQFGNGIGQIPVVFAAGNGSGTVTNGSVLSSAGTGYAEVGAWILSSIATQTLTVTSASLPGVTQTFTANIAPGAAFSVCARFVGDATPRQRQAVATAVQRWQRVIVGHTQSTQLTEPANRCFPGAPALNEVVEDLLVFVRFTSLDGIGNAAARASPCTVHLPSNITQMGQIQIDSADVEGLLGQGTLDNLITHEMGHVLGFGTVWSSLGLINGSGGADPFFSGASARAQFLQLFSSYASSPVPVENTGDPGTRDSHWRHSVFDNELMQGFITDNMPMSRVTVGSLADIGYTVDATKADPFTFRGAVRAESSPDSQARTSQSRTSQLINDVADNDVWGVDKNGARKLLHATRNPQKRN